MNRALVRLLIVDDDEDDYILARDLLADIETIKVELQWACDYDQALHLFRQNIFDVCLLDFRLGEYTALDLLPVFLEIDPIMPIIILTGQDDLQTDLNVMDAGASDYLIKKDLNTPLLERAIRYALKRRQSMTALRDSQRELSAYVERLTLLQQIEAELSDVLDVDHVAMMALDTAVRISSADIAFFVLTTEDGDYSILRQIGAARERIAPDGVVARVLKTGQAAFLPDVTQDPDYVPANPNTRAQITVPLRVDEETVIGALNLETAYPERFTPEVFQFLQMVCARASIALENARLYQIAQRRFEELKVAYEQISELELLKTDMLRIATHDLRNPLSHFLGYLEMFEWESNQLIPKHQDFLKNMRRSAERMKHIIEDITMLDRERTMRGKALQDVLDLRTTVRAASQHSQHEAEEKNQALNVHMPDTPAFVLGDPVQLHEAVINLINNAIKYTPNGGSVDVLLQIKDGQAHLEVCDTGIGIPQEAQARLFEPFYRVKTAQTVGIDGTGLGLHLVKNIVERHKGQVLFRSELGQGSMFGFTLPITGDRKDGYDRHSPSRAVGG